MPFKKNDKKPQPDRSRKVNQDHIDRIERDKQDERWSGVGSYTNFWQRRKEAMSAGQTVREPARAKAQRLLDEKTEKILDDVPERWADLDPAVVERRIRRQVKDRLEDRFGNVWGRDDDEKRKRKGQKKHQDPKKKHPRVRKRRRRRRIRIRNNCKGCNTPSPVNPAPGTPGYGGPETPGTNTGNQPSPPGGPGGGTTAPSPIPPRSPQPPPPPTDPPFESRIGYFVSISDMGFYEEEPKIYELPTVEITFEDEDDGYLTLTAGQEWVSEWQEGGVIRGLNVDVNGRHKLSFVDNGGFEN